jgi:DNA-directed RNA polymerase subunit RPC12/RpoP
MSKNIEELKSVMVICYKCGWSFSSRKPECPMCGAEIILKVKDLVQYLGEYIDRQGLTSSKKECEKFIDEFKKKNKRLPNLDEIWTAAVDFAKIQKMDKKDLKKMKEKQDVDLKDQMEKLKKKKMDEAQKKKTEKPVPAVGMVEHKKSTNVKSETDQRIEEMRKKREEITSKIAKAPGKKEEKKKPFALDEDEDEAEESIPEASQIKFEDIEEEDKGEPKLTIPSAPPMAPKNYLEKPTAINKETKETKQDSASDIIICPTCGLKNPKGSKFCQEDGTPL